MTVPLVGAPPVVWWERGNGCSGCFLLDRGDGGRHRRELMGLQQGMFLRIFSRWYSSPSFFIYNYFNLMKPFSPFVP